MSVSELIQTYGPYVAEHVVPVVVEGAKWTGEKVKNLGIFRLAMMTLAGSAVAAPSALMGAGIGAAVGSAFRQPGAGALVGGGLGAIGGGTVGAGAGYVGAEGLRLGYKVAETGVKATAELGKGLMTVAGNLVENPVDTASAVVGGIAGAKLGFLLGGPWGSFMGAGLGMFGGWALKTVFTGAASALNSPQPESPAQA